PAKARRFKGQPELLVALLQGLLRTFSPAHIHGYAQHAFGLTVRRVKEFSFRTQPARRSVWPEHAEFLAAHCSVPLSGFQALTQGRLVVWMRLRPIPGGREALCSNRGSEQHLMIADPRAFSCPDIQVPNFCSSRFQSELQTLVRQL